jgi:hypothetical protein
MGSGKAHALGKLRINAFYGFFPTFSNKHHQGTSTKLSFKHLKHGATLTSSWLYWNEATMPLTYVLT